MHLVKYTCIYIEYIIYLCINVIDLVPNGPIKKLVFFNFFNGVKQGAFLYPLLFNYYIDASFEPSKLNVLFVMLVMFVMFVMVLWLF